MKLGKGFSRRSARMGELKRNGKIINLLGLVPLVWGLFLVFMVFWALNVALSDPAWYLDNANAVVTQKFTLQNFVEVASKFKMQVSDAVLGIRYVEYGEMIWNTLVWCVCTCVVNDTASILFSYAVARFNFPGRKFFYAFVILQLMIPTYGVTAANYSLLAKLNMIDNMTFYLALGAGHGMEFLIRYNFFRNISREYDEAAKIDGAGPFRIFWNVIFPTARPITMAFLITGFIGAWNNYSDVLLYQKSHPTLSSALYTLRDQAFYLGLQTPTFFAGIFMAIVPVGLLFVIFNKQIMENMTVGGLKG